MIDSRDTAVVATSITALEGRAVIWGAGGHAKVVADTLRDNPKIVLEGFLDDISPERWGTSFYGASILGNLRCLESLYPSKEIFVALGVGSNIARMRALSNVKEMGFRLLTIISSTASISPSARIGEGAAIMPHVVINADAMIGNGAIINTGSTVDHDCTIEDGVHIAPGVTLAGSCIIQKEAFVGIGSCVREDITIGSNAIVGAGTVVIANIPPNVTAYGNPARVVENR
jgi:sugar O-acyltransferase (sialic acid O-acetyltransferase NeuD family)